MSNKLRDILSQIEHDKFATESGRNTHFKLQHIIITSGHQEGDEELCKKILSCPKLLRFFGSNSKVEVPIAGYLNGRFVSRRIDRLIIDEGNKEIQILDYKTDTNKQAFYEKYIIQIKEYSELLQSLYPDYKITGYILWLKDFSLEKIL